MLAAATGGPLGTARFATSAGRRDPAEIGTISFDVVLFPLVDSHYPSTRAAAEADVQLVAEAGVRRLGRVQAQVVLSVGGMEFGPAGFTVLNFNGVLQAALPWVELMIDPDLHCAFKKAENLTVAGFKYPFFMPSEFSEPLNRDQGRVDDPFRKTAFPVQLGAMLSTIARLLAAQKSQPAPKESVVRLALEALQRGPLDFHTWAQHAVTAVGTHARYRELASSAESGVTVTQDLPLCQPGDVIIWTAIHSNMEPYQADAKPGTAVVSKLSSSLILDFVGLSDLERVPGASAAYTRCMAGFRDGCVSSFRAGHNQGDRDHEAEYWQTRGLPPVPALTTEQAEYLGFQPRTAAGISPAATSCLADRHHHELRGNGFTVVRASELYTTDAPLEAYRARVSAALTEFQEYFKWVVYDRVGVAVKAGMDPFQSIRGEVDAVRVCDQKHIMNRSKLGDALVLSITLSPRVPLWTS